MTEYKTKVGYYPPIELHYEEPVWDAMNKAAEEVVANIRNDTDRMVIGACMKVGVSVDKDELVRALRYDRGQYEKGYADGKRDAAAAIEELQQIADHYEQTAKDYWKEACEYKAQLPKRGEWTEIEDYDGDFHYQCSVCGEEWYFIDGTPADNNANYCPRCGAKMTCRMKHKLRFYRAAIKWLWQHRTEPNNRHKWRRMMREVQE